MKKMREELAAGELTMCGGGYVGIGRIGVNDRGGGEGAWERKGETTGSHYLRVAPPQRHFAE